MDIFHWVVFDWCTKTSSGYSAFLRKHEHSFIKNYFSPGFVSKWGLKWAIDGYLPLSSFWLMH